MANELKPSIVAQYLRDHISVHGAVQLPGIGRLTIKDVKSRPCRNPQTGETMLSKAKTVYVLRAGKEIAP